LCSCRLHARSNDAPLLCRHSLPLGQLLVHLVNEVLEGNLRGRRRGGGTSASGWLARGLAVAATVVLVHAPSRSSMQRAAAAPTPHPLQQTAPLPVAA